MNKLALIALFVLAAPAAAQQRDYRDALERANLPRSVRSTLRDLFEDPATHSYQGATIIAAGDTIRGAVAVLDGPLTIAGRIEGDVGVIEGDVVFEPGGFVTGDLTVALGSVRGVGDGAGTVAGSLLVYGEEAEREGDEYDDDHPRSRRVRLFDSPRAGAARLVLRPNDYNRVEGLRIRIGPSVTTAGSNPTRLEAFALVRTEGDLFDREDLGYLARAEQFLGGRRELRLGVSARSAIEPIEAWSLTHAEHALGTFLFRYDDRDYFERTGWSAYTRWTPRALPLDVTLEYSDEDHARSAPRDPWTLVNNSDAWRPQPAVAKGSLRSLEARVEVDARDHHDDPHRGWFLSGTLRQGLGGSLSANAATRFTSALVDIRHYNAVQRRSQLNLRAVAGGTLDDTPLPPQYQHALGGVGSLPGYGLFSADCGARATQIQAASEGPLFFPNYGCDRFALFQAEYMRRLGRDWQYRPSAAWVLFADVGRGWVVGRTNGFGAADTRTLYDVGLGLIFGDIGIYAALPLNDQDDNGLSLFARLGRRF